MDSAMYTRWYGDKLWVMVPAQAVVGQFLQSFIEFPQRQKSAATNVSIQQILDRMQKKND
jgi:arylsulfatase